MNLKINTGFESAEIETRRNYAYADVKRAARDLEDTIANEAVHLVISDDVYWAADDLRELAEALKLIADAIDTEIEDDQEDYDDEDPTDRAAFNEWSEKNDYVYE